MTDNNRRKVLEHFLNVHPDKDSLLLDLVSATIETPNSTELGVKIQKILNTDIYAAIDN